MTNFICRLDVHVSAPETGINDTGAALGVSDEGGGGNDAEGTG